MRVWGTLNSAGTAGFVWSLAVVVAFADRTWRLPVRAVVLTVLIGGLMITLVRIGWIMAVVGVVAYLAMSRRRDKLRLMALAAVCGVILVAVTPLLPGGDRITSRMQTFGELENDGSFRSRVSITLSLAEEILSEPIGRGIGFKTAGKVSGDSVSLTAIDNGYGDLFLSLGLLGGAAYALGVLLIAVQVSPWGPRSRVTSDRATLSGLAVAYFVATAAGTFSAFVLTAAAGTWTWLVLGLAAPTSYSQIKEL